MPHKPDARRGANDARSSILIEMVARKFSTRAVAGRRRSRGDTAAPRIVLGLGTGRCGTKSLARLLNAQPGFSVTHEARPILPWQGTQHGLESKIARMWGRKGRAVGDVCFSYLPYIERAFRTFPNLVAVCMQRQREATVQSLMRKTVGRNHWGIHGPDDRRDARWDACFPTYPERDKEAAVRRYWDEYACAAATLEAKYPERFRVVDLDALNDEAQVRELLRFVAPDLARPRIVVGAVPEIRRASRTRAKPRRHARPLQHARTLLRPTDPLVGGSLAPATMRELAAIRRHYCEHVSRDAMAIPLAAIETAARAIRVEDARRVLDLGSGFSSVSLRHLRERGHLPSLETLCSVDDDPKWLAASRAYCRARDLDDSRFFLWTDSCGGRGGYDLVIYDLGNMTVRARELRTALHLVRSGGLVYLDDLHKPAYATAVADAAAELISEVHDVADREIDRFGRFGMLARVRR